MQNVSKEYKEIMNRMIRNRGYMSVSIGIVNQEAQSDAKFDGNYMSWSNKTFPFKNQKIKYRYATMEENYFKMDGSILFPPEESYQQSKEEVGIVTESLLGTAVVNFGTDYDIKGITIDFSPCYPTKFSIVTENGTFNYTNDNQVFSTTEVFENTGYMIITPTAMVGGQQRLRIDNITMGVGLNFSNDELQSSNYTDYVHAVSEELPHIDFSVTVFDQDNLFNVDDNNSFIHFLETMQPITLSAGLELDNGSVEWIEMGNLYLDDWSSKKGSITFTAKDLISFMNDSYLDGNTIHTRTLYDDAVDVLTDFGLEPDEYEIDECLKDIIVTNPLPTSTHAECLQLIANAGRCILYQSRSGKICLKANFANVIDPDDLVVTSDTASSWSKISNVPKGTDYVYADMTQDFFPMDGSMYFMPEDGSYFETSFISAEVSNEFGDFDINPSLAIELPAGYIYYSIFVNFDGNPPLEMKVRTYYSDELQETVIFNELSKENILNHEFSTFDKMTFEFTKASPNDRVLVNKISFGDLSDYTLRSDDMLEYPIGFKERKTKSVSVKIFTYTNGTDNKPVLKDDDVYYANIIDTVGNHVKFENQLISTAEHAQDVAEWLGNYYANNVSYDVDYRGEPRLNASDIIFMESDVLSNLQVEITKNEFSFNGKFGGRLELRRALKMMGA